MQGHGTGAYSGVAGFGGESNGTGVYGQGRGSSGSGSGVRGIGSPTIPLRGIRILKRPCAYIRLQPGGSRPGDAGRGGKGCSLGSDRARVAIPGRAEGGEKDRDRGSTGTVEPH